MATSMMLPGGPDALPGGLFTRVRGSMEFSEVRLARGHSFAADAPVPREWHHVGGKGSNVRGAGCRKERLCPPKRIRPSPAEGARSCGEKANWRAPTRSPPPTTLLTGMAERRVGAECRSRGSPD